MSNLPLAALAAGGGFSSDPRFGGGVMPSKVEEPGEDPVALAFAEGHAAGLAEARAEAEQQRALDDAARTKIELALARLDGEQEEALRQRLTATVQVLCEAVLAPLALDMTALAERVGRAVAMLARADDEAVLRLHPDDIALLKGRLPDNLEVSPDPSLERGALRLEGSAGGIEDGPPQWRRVLSEALGPC